MNKLKIIPFFFLAVLLLLTACSSKQETGEDRFQDEREYLIMANLTESDKGIYGVEWGEEYSPIFFVDKTTGKKTILCQKVNCKHNSEECPAVENGIVGCLAYSNGTLYFMVQKLEKEELELQLYSMKEDGSKKKKLHTFKNVRIFPNQAGLYKGKIVISAQTQKELEDGSGKYTVPCGGSENGIYLVQIPWEDTEQEQECEYLRYDFETGKLSEVYKTTISNMQIIKNDILYLQSEGKQQLEKYNIKTQEKKIVLEWQDDADEIWAREDYIEFRKNTEEGEEKKVYCNWYDFEEEKYLFDEYQDLNKIKVEDKTENGYWIYKEGEPYFYHLEDKSWQKIEEIK